MDQKIIKLTRSQWQRILGFAIRDQVRAGNRTRAGMVKNKARPSEIAMTMADYQRERDLIGEIFRSDGVTVERDRG